ncbi:hypothetical protein D3C73_1514870 [compost metagenome]
MCSIRDPFGVKIGSFPVCFINIDDLYAVLRSCIGINHFVIANIDTDMADGFVGLETARHIEKQQVASSQIGAAYRVA